MLFDFLIYQQFKGGTLIRFLISMLSNLTETLHSSAKLENKQVAKIWGLQLKKQRFGDTMHFPEGLENTPFTTWINFFWKIWIVQ